MSAKPTIDYADDVTPQARPAPIRAMEIGGPSLARRITGWIGYLFVFATVAGLLTAMFMQFSVPWRIALAIVLFMIGYMCLTAWWSSRSDENFGSMR